MGVEAGLVKRRTDGSGFFSPSETLGCYKLQHHVCGPGETRLGGAKCKVSRALTALGDPQSPPLRTSAPPPPVEKVPREYSPTKDRGWEWTWGGGDADEGIGKGNIRPFRLRPADDRNCPAADGLCVCMYIIHTYTDT